MPAASEVLLAISTLPSGATSAEHIKSARERARSLGINLETTIETLASDLIGEVVTSNVETIIADNSTLSTSANVQTLTASISC